MLLISDRTLSDHYTNLKKYGWNHFLKSKTTLLSHLKARYTVEPYFDDLHVTLLVSRVCASDGDIQYDGCGHAIHILSIMSRQQFKLTSSNLEPTDARRWHSSSLHHGARLRSRIPASTLSIDPTDCHAALSLSVFFSAKSQVGMVWKSTRGYISADRCSLSLRVSFPLLFVSHHFLTYSFFWFIRRFSVKFPGAPQ